MHCGLSATIVAYRLSIDIDVQFEDGEIRTHVSYHDFVKGNINPIAKSELYKNVRVNEDR